jgi:hypothetical protein
MSPCHAPSARSFRLVNYRQPMALALVRGGLSAPVEVARSRPITVSHPNEPLQGHLARTADPKEMLVQWTSLNCSEPVVQWGSRSETLDRTARAASSSYSREDMCGGAAATTGWVESGTQHFATLTGLEPGRR